MGQLPEKIAPTIPSLVEYVKANTQLQPIYVKQIKKVNGVNIITLSNGSSYFIADNNQWESFLPEPAPHLSITP